MVSNGDIIDVNDFGMCRIEEIGEDIVYLVEEEDDSINWYVNPDSNSDRILLARKVTFISRR
jgi:hypothetical protein